MISQLEIPRNIDIYIYMGPHPGPRGAPGPEPPGVAPNAYSLPRYTVHTRRAAPHKQPIRNAPVTLSNHLLMEIGTGIPKNAQQFQLAPTVTANAHVANWPALPLEHVWLHGKKRGPVPPPTSPLGPGRVPGPPAWTPGLRSGDGEYLKAQGHHARNAAPPRPFSIIISPRPGGPGFRPGSGGPALTLTVFTLP